MAPVRKVVPLFVRFPKNNARKRFVMRFRPCRVTCGQKDLGSQQDIDRSEGGQRAAMNFLIGVCTPKLENVSRIG
jgi:hypothetical protein